jgi:hypothetical protein
VKVAGTDQGRGDTADSEISLSLENISFAYTSGNRNQEFSTTSSSILPTKR